MRLIAPFAPRAEIHHPGQWPDHTPDLGGAGSVIADNRLHRPIAGVLIYRRQTLRRAEMAGEAVDIIVGARAARLEIQIGEGRFAELNDSTRPEDRGFKKFRLPRRADDFGLIPIGRAGAFENGLTAPAARLGAGSSPEIPDGGAGALVEAE